MARCLNSPFQDLLKLVPQIRHMCVYVHVHAHTHTHTPVLKSSCIYDHFSSAFWHSCRALLWWLITRKDSALERQDQVENLLQKTMNRHQQQCISWKWLVLDLSKVPSLWTLCLGPGLGKAFHQTFVQQINFANVGKKTQGMKFLMLRECDSAEKHWISSLHFMCHILSNSPWPHYCLKSHV